MNSLTLATAYLRHKLANTILTMLTFAMGLAIILSLLTLNKGLENEFSKNLKGIDLVVSGKGSPLQIILSAVFHLDIPTGNISFEEAEELQKHPLVANAVPLALGDNYNGHRIVGTNAEYIQHYNGTLAQGKIFAGEMEVVIGSEVATKNQVKLGDKIVGSHGLTSSDDHHADSPYTVVGILNPNNTVLDRLVLTPVESVWHVHGHEDHGHKEEHHEGELTALLITYKSPLAASILPREINKHSSMQAASPAAEMARLVSLMGTGTETIKAFGYLIIGLGALIMFINLYNAMNERKYDLALMRSLGGTKAKLLGIEVTESLILALGGAILGIGLSYGLNMMAGNWLAQEKGIKIAIDVPLEAIIAVIGASTIIALIASVIPAFKVYGIDTYKILTNR